MFGEIPVRRTRAELPGMLLGSASIGKVAPIIVRPTCTVCFPSQTIAQTGPLLMSRFLVNAH